MIFKDSMTALVTPFRDGKIDEAALKKTIDFQIENGTHVLVPCGSTGESATLTRAEFERVIHLTVEHNAGRVKILAGAGSNATAEAVSRHEFCRKAGADGTLHITPYYNKPTPSGLLAHFKAVAESSDLPIVLYNVPSRTGVNMLPDTVLRLAECTNIVGIKEASGSLDQASEIISGSPMHFSLYSGEDSLTFPLLALGAKGVVSVTANVAPAEVAALCAAMQDHNFTVARDKHFELFALNKILFVETNPIPVKTALNLMGMVEEEFRLPLTKMTAQNREALKVVLKEMGKIF